MSENCDGANVSEEKIETPETITVETTRVIKFDKEITPDSSFHGFIMIPYVYLVRYDITPYLNKSKRSTPHSKIYNKRSKLDKMNQAKWKVDSIHQARLSEPCVVKLVRDDLERLKASLPYRSEASASKDSVYSDSDTSNSTQITMKCNICDKKYNSEKKLLNHQQNKHIIYKKGKKPHKKVRFSDHVTIHEVKEYHKCRKCPKIFEDYQTLKLHMKQFHKKRKCYICNYCGKNFVDRMFFKVHIRLHCDVCGNLLESKAKLVEHRHSICQVIKLYKCKACNMSFFKFMHLKDHSYEHIGALFVCDICKDQFPTKCAIGHHIAFSHSKKRPKSIYSTHKVGSEFFYLCNFCDKSSVELEVIKKHGLDLPDLTNETMTGYRDFYFCDQCMAKFTTEHSMLQHKWTHFLKKSDNSQVRQRSRLIKPKSEVKSSYKTNEELPASLKPLVVLEKTDNIITIEDNAKSESANEDSHKPDHPCIVNPLLTALLNSKENNLQHMTEVIIPSGDHNTLKISGKAIVDPKRKKTIISKFQCETCHKFFSNNYCLNRHISKMHFDFENLKCKVCEETFVWPSLLKSHKCIRLKHPEMPFDDARPEIQFDNLHVMPESSIDDLNFENASDYMNGVDFEIPAPIVELRESDSAFICDVGQQKNSVSNGGYKLVMQEVPIEF